MSVLPRNNLLLLLLALGVAIASTPSLSSAEQVDLSQIAPKVDKSKKVSHEIYEIRELSQSAALTSQSILETHRAKLFGDSIQVEVLLVRDADSDLRQLLSESGGRIHFWYQKSVEMIVPLHSLKWFEDQPEVAGMYLPHYAEPLSVISEGLDTLGIPQFHTKGYRGQGVKIAVLDGGFKDYSLYLGTELPANIHGGYFGSSFENDSKHGTWCAQVVYDVAPNAELWLFQFDTDLQFLAAMDTVQSKGIDVVSCSMGFFGTGWPDGSSPMSQRVQQLKNAGVLWVNSAGNHARMHWRGNFSDVNSDGYHDFTSLDMGNSIYLSSGTNLRASLSWNDYPASDQDFDLELRESSSGVLVSQSIHAQTGSQPPEEILSYVAPASGQYYLAIKKYKATTNPVMHLYVIEGASELQYYTESKSVLLPGDSRGALTVGAVPWAHSGTIEYFSSRGPTEDNRTKPDLVGPDSISVKDGYWTEIVQGTSFSCPHVAGAAAVYLSYKPLVVPAAVMDTFKTMCIDRGATGPDNTYGWGLLHLKMRNSPPVLTNPGNKTVNENGLLSFGLSASDADGDPLTYAANPLPTGANFSSSNGSFVWQPTLDQEGIYSVTFSVSDGQASDQKTIQITVLHVNQPPLLTNPDNKTVAENGTLAFNLSASDPDGDPLTYSANPLPSGANFSNSTGSFAWTPTYDQAGSYGITFAVSDGQATGQASITITVNNVNRPPSSFALSTPKNDDTVASMSATLRWGRSVDPDAGDFVKYKLLYAKSEQPLAISPSSTSLQFVDNKPPFSPKEPPNLRPMLSGAVRIQGLCQPQDSMQLDFNADVNNWYVSDSAWVDYICPGTQCDGCAERRKPKPSQIYWTSFDSKGSLAFIGNHLGFWNSDCDYEWWQRYTHGALPSTWRNIRRIELRVFNQSDDSVWLAVQYWQAETQHWVFIKNSPVWTSLGSRAWTTIAVSDSTGEAITSMYWISLDFLACHHEDPIYVDWIRGVSGDAALVWQDSVQNISDTSFVLDNLSQQYYYYWKIVAYDNEKASTDCSNGSYSFFAADATPPSFTIDILPNPVLPFELDLFFYPSEPLSGLPEVTVTSPSGSSAQAVTQLSNRDATCYLTDYQIAQSGSYTITACGTDLSTNRGCKDANLSASRLFVNSGADLISSSGALRLRIPAGSSRSDGLVFCEERPVSVSDLVNANLPADITPIHVVDLKSTVTISNKPALLTIDPEVAGFLVEAGQTMVLVSLSSIGQQPIPTRVNVATGQCVAELAELGSYLIGTAGIGKLETLPVSYQLDQNIPNPFNGSTVIPFSTGEPGHVTLEVFNVLGQRVTTLFDKEVLPGNYFLSWDGKTETGTECSSGAYFYRLTAGSHLETKKMLYLK
jgi:hypothetical protein